jgi:hypothetical protein
LLIINSNELNHKDQKKKKQTGYCHHHRGRQRHCCHHFLGSKTTKKGTTCDSFVVKPLKKVMKVVISFVTTKPQKKTTAHCHRLLCYNKTKIEGDDVVAFCFATKKKDDNNKVVVTFFVIVK